MTKETLHTIISPINQLHLPEQEEKQLYEKIYRVLLDDKEIYNIAYLVPNVGQDLSVVKLLLYDETDESTLFLPDEVTAKLPEFDILVSGHLNEIQQLIDKAGE